MWRTCRESLPSRTMNTPERSCPLLEMRGRPSARPRPGSRSAGSRCGGLHLAPGRALGQEHLVGAALDGVGSSMTTRPSAADCGTCVGVVTTRCLPVNRPRTPRASQSSRVMNSTPMPGPRRHREALEVGNGGAAALLGNRPGWPVKRETLLLGGSAACGPRSAPRPGSRRRPAPRPYLLDRGRVHVDSCHPPARRAGAKLKVARRMARERSE
jgi:hypothetical protein